MTSARRWFTRTGNRIGVWLYRRTDGRWSSWSPDIRVAMVTTPGRRTGLPRPACMRYLQHGDSLLVWGTGSGSPRDPDWFENLRRAEVAEVQVRDRRFRAVPRELLGDERDRVWRDVVLVQAPQVAKYAAKAGRPIPVAVLSPVDPGERRPREPGAGPTDPPT